MKLHHMHAPDCLQLTIPRVTASVAVALPERKRCKTDVQAILRTVLVFQTPIMTSLLHKQTNARYLRT